MTTRWYGAASGAFWKTNPTSQLPEKQATAKRRSGWRSELYPRVIVMDCALPGMNGLEATRKILENTPQALVLMLSMHPEETWVQQALAAGARGYILKNAVDLELGAAIRRVVAGEKVLDSQLDRPEALKGERGRGAHAAGIADSAEDRGWQIEQRDCLRVELEREYGRGSPRQYDGYSGHSQDCRTGGLCYPQRVGEPSVNRRQFLQGMAGVASAASLDLPRVFAAPEINPGFRLVDVTSGSGIHFQHNTGAYGGKLLPETLGSGCAFLDYDADGWQDILLINGMDWPGHKRQRTTLRLYQEQSQRNIHRCYSRFRPRYRDVWHGSSRRGLQQ